jgi:hypothetical protein
MRDKRVSERQSFLDAERTLTRACESAACLHALRRNNLAQHRDQQVATTMRSPGHAGWSHRNGVDIILLQPYLHRRYGQTASEIQTCA